VWRLILGLIALSTLGLAAAACNLGFIEGQDIGPPGDDDDDDFTTDDDDDVTDDDDDTTPSGSVSLSSISPTTGPLTGGYNAQLFGTNFTDPADTVVWFGSTTAPVTGCSTGQCTVSVPSTSQPGSVQVSLQNSNGTAVLADGFTYTQDLSGLTSYFAEVVRTEYLYPDAFNPPPTSQTYAQAVFFAPDTFDMYNDLVWSGLLPSPGSCTTFDWDNTTVIEVSPYDAGTSVSLTGASNFSLIKEDFYYIVDGLSLGQYQPGDYTLNIPGGTDLSSETVPNAVYAPGVFSVIPVMDPYQTNRNGFVNSGMSLGMQGANCPAAVVAMDMYVDSGGQYLEYDRTILCHYSTGATMLVPSSVTSQFPAAGAAVVTVECYNQRIIEIDSGADMAGIGRAVINGVIYFI
jgi:hypothetical protein